MTPRHRDGGLSAVDSGHPSAGRPAGSRARRQRVTARFPVSGLPEPGSSGQLTLDVAPTDGFGVPEVIADGALVGIAQDSREHFALVSFALPGGKRRWVAPLPDQVDDLTVGGNAQRGKVVLVDESEPAYSLDEIGLATGELRSFGFFQGTALEPGDSGLYTVGNDYVVVNLDGSGLSPPVVAIKAPVARHQLPAG